MKSRQLLSVVFSLIMFTGVTAGNVAFADTHDDLIEDFKDCVEAGGIIGDNLIECTLDGVIFVNDEDDTDDDVIEDFEDCVEAGYPIMESFPEQCMTDDGQTFTNTDDDDDDENEDEFRKSHDFDGMSDTGKDHMSDTAKDRHEELKKKFSEQSERIKSMIMDKRDISDERHDEIKMKFEEKFGEDSDKKRSEIKMKYKDHMLKMKFKMSDERKSDVHDRVAEMKAYKAELREQSSQITDEEKQQLREEFIEKAKDMQLAWISPRTQITAGVDPVDVECREGFNLVMKASNGVAICLKADTAFKMIDRGIVVPTN